MKANHAFILVILFLLNVPAKSQTYAGLRAGMDLSNVDWTRGTSKYPTRYKSGWHVGLTINTPVRVYNHSLFIQSGILLSAKGFKEDSENDFGNGDFIVNPIYLEFPVNLIYYIPNRTDKNVFLGGGFYGAYGVLGQWEIKYDTRGWHTGHVAFVNSINEETRQLLSEGEVFNYGKKIDYGVNFLVGYELTSRLQVQANGQIGLRNIASEYEGRSTKEDIRNVGGSLSLGFIL